MKRNGARNTNAENPNNMNGFANIPTLVNRNHPNVGNMASVNNIPIGSQWQPQPYQSN